MKLSNGLIAAVLLTVTVPVCAQSLGDLAKKEQERRKTLPPATKTYTNEDLKKLPPSADDNVKPADKAKADDAIKAGDPAKPGGTKPEAATSPEPAKDEKYWRGRITAAKDDIAKNEAFRDALQSQINGLAAEFSARDDPNQRAKIADDRQKALAQLASVTEAITKGIKAIADIEEEARRAGVPPGWLR
ncbi:MAG TPA: hypothetical protein VF921_08840 [Vicinamibacterales bacterium]